MCTVSWIHTHDGYQLLCNRDEKDTRLPAAAPQIAEAEGVRFVAPIDGDFGGTWIAANEHGVTLALLNRQGIAPRASQSRGHLVTELAGVASIAALRQRLTQSMLAPFACFTLVALEAGQPACVFEWDGRWLATTPSAEHRMPLTSSSFDAEAVETQRRLEFSARIRAAGDLNPELLFQFHQSHGLKVARPSAYSTCMHRPGAQTVSFTWVDVSPSAVRLFYSPAAPCKWVPGDSLELERKVALAAWA